MLNMQSVLHCGSVMDSCLQGAVPLLLLVLPLYREMLTFEDGSFMGGGMQGFNELWGRWIAV